MKDFEKLWKIAGESLSANIVALESGLYLTAGRHQFKTLWTRDFCMSVRGLLRINRSDVAKHHLQTLIRARRSYDGLVPRVMDSMSTPKRVSLYFLAKILPFIHPDRPLVDPLITQYRDEHGTEAIDSNLLVLLAALDIVDKTGDSSWWAEHEGALIEIYRFYDSKFRNSLIVQPPFSDWQDSTRRDGHTFYTNLLYCVASRRLAKYPGFGVNLKRVEEMRAMIEETFRDKTTGLFLSIAGKTQISVDGNLLAIDLGYFAPKSEEATALYESLKRHPLWKGRSDLPGYVTFPNYPNSWKSVAVRVARLHFYHDRIYWSWLMGLAAKVATLQGDQEEASRILGRLNKIAIRDSAIGEIYTDTPELNLWRSRWFEAEIPFSWGAAFVIDAAMTYLGA